MPPTTVSSVAAPHSIRVFIGGPAFNQDPVFICPPSLETPASIRDRTFIVIANAVVFVVSLSLFFLCVLLSGFCGGLVTLLQ